MDLRPVALALVVSAACQGHEAAPAMRHEARVFAGGVAPPAGAALAPEKPFRGDRQSAAGEIGRGTRLNSSHRQNSYAGFCLEKKNLLAIALWHAMPVMVGGAAESGGSSGLD